MSKRSFAVPALVLTLTGIAAPTLAAPEAEPARIWVDKDGPWHSRHWRTGLADSSETHLVCLDEAPGVTRWVILDGPGAGQVLSMDGKAFACDKAPTWLDDVLDGSR